ncbi:unnamed protein product, partial [Lymnaea stagnalis]
RIIDPHIQGGAASPDPHEGALSPYMVAVSDTVDIEVEKSQLEIVGNKSASEIYDLRSVAPVESKLLDQEQSLQLREELNPDISQKVDTQNFPRTDIKQAPPLDNTPTTPPDGNSSRQIATQDADSKALTTAPDAYSNTLTTPSDA